MKTPKPAVASSDLVRRLVLGLVARIDAKLPHHSPWQQSTEGWDAVATRPEMAIRFLNLSGKCFQQGVENLWISWLYLRDHFLACLKRRLEVILHTWLSRGLSYNLSVEPNDQHQRCQPAASDARTAADINGWLASAGCCG